MKDPALHWPYLIVSWKEDGELCWEKVHRDHIRRNPAATQTKAADRQGDGVTQSTRGVKPFRVRVMPGRKIEDLEGQGELF